MKNCISGGKNMTAHLRVAKKQISESRLKKLMKKKWERKNGQANTQD